MPYKIIHEGKDFHGAGCDCGSCNSNGHSYGMGIYWADNELMDLRLAETIVTLYGPSESAVEHNALMYISELESKEVSDDR